MAKKKRIGIIIGKIGGIDGVALETEKWIQVLKELGHEVFVLAGLYERPILDKEHATKNPLLSFYSKDNKIIREKAFLNPNIKCKNLMGKIKEQSDKITKSILKWIQDKNIEIIISENASSYPAHIPLGIAIKNIAEITDLKIIAHDHDFYWERGKMYHSPFKKINNLIKETFLTKNNNIKHIVINHNAKKVLKKRFDIDALVIPNVMDFSMKFAKKTKYNKDLRKDLGLKKDDILLFQVTRIVRRKKIETAIELIKRLKNPKVKLIVTGVVNNDLERDYLKELKKIVAKLKLQKQVLFAGDYFDPCASFVEEGYVCKHKRGHKTYSLSDAYAHADACTYFSDYEGFGNAFVEAVLAKKPIFVNNYKPVYWQEIGNKGFKTVMIENNRLTKKAIEKIKKIIYNKKLAKEIANYNFKIGKKYFSYKVLKKKLRQIGF